MQVCNYILSQWNHVDHTKLSNATISNRLTLHEAATHVDLFINSKNEQNVCSKGSGHVLNISQMS